MTASTDEIVLGAVAYDAKVVPIWDGFQAWFAARGFAFDPTSDIYTSNLGLIWASRYPTTQPVQDHLAFDVSPTARALILFIKDANVEVRLPDP